MSEAIIGEGTLLKMGDGATPEVFTTVAELVNVKPAGLTRNRIPVGTHNNGPADILGALNKGPVTCMINWVPNDATHAQIEADIAANTKRNWRITYPPSGLPHDTFPARVESWDVPEIGIDTPMQATVSLAIDGNITRVTST